MWFQLAIATPGPGPALLSKAGQKFARYLLRSFSYNWNAWSDEDIELFVAQLREPERARACTAGSSCPSSRESCAASTGTFD